MQYKQSPLDRFLQQRISDNAKELKNTLEMTLQEEQRCLEEIRFSINHCKENIAACEKMIKKYNGYSSQIIASKKSAFEDNLAIWNLLGHIQMASIEMKEFLKRLSVEYIDEWEQRSVIKSAYTAIYETSKKLVDGFGKIFDFIKRYFPSYDYSIFASSRKELTTFRDNKTPELTRIRKGIDAHRENDIVAQLDIIEGLHLSDAIKLINEYGMIINKLGQEVKPIIDLGLKRLQEVFQSR